jgi:uncharacterized membrane protein
MKQTVATTASQSIGTATNPRAFYDLLLLAALALCLPLLVLLPLPFLRVPLGLLLVLIAPGYAVCAALFARRNDLDGVTRLALSFGVSIALLPLLALALDMSSLGIRLWPMTWALLGWIELWCVLAAARRAWLLRANAAVLPPPIALRGWWSGLNRRRRWACLAGLLGSGVLVWIGSGLPGLVAQMPATEFYVLGAGGLAEDYPREAVVGVETQVQLGIYNHSGNPVAYRVEVRAGNSLLGRLNNIQLPAGHLWEQPLRFKPDRAGDDQRVDIVLFRGAETTPHRHLQLWINVQEPQP